MIKKILIWSLLVAVIAAIMLICDATRWHHPLALTGGGPEESVVTEVDPPEILLQVRE